MDLLAVHTLMVTFHVLRDSTGLYLIDTGFVGGRARLAQALRARGWEREPIRGILLTHGHLDHTFNAAALARETGAWIAAPRLDVEHLAARYPYRGSARMCGWLEATGRQVFGYEAIPVGRWLDDGEELGVWQDLCAVHLPGHTAGHMGFYSPSRKLLFSGDLVASSLGFAYRPPFFLNSCPELIPASIAKACGLELDGVIPNHGDRVSPAVHLRRLRKLNLRQG